MRKLLLALGFCLAAGPAFAQCTGVFPAKTICGNLGATAAPPSPWSSSGSIVGPSNSTSGDLAIFSNNAGTAITDAGSLTGAVITSNYTFSGNITLQGFNYFSGQTSLTTANITSGFLYLGNLMTFPSVASTIPGTAATNNWTGFNNFSGATSMTGAVSMSAPVIAGQGPVTIPVSVAFGGTGNATATAGSIPINQGTAPQTNTGTGSVGQCAASYGSGSPGFASGCRVLLTTLVSPTTAYSASTVLSGYADYEIVIDNLLPNTNNTTCIIEIYAGPGYQNVGYVAEVIDATGSNTAVTTGIPCSGSGNVTNITSQGVSTTCEVPNAGSSTSIKNAYCLGSYINSTTSHPINSGGAFTTTTSPITGVSVGFINGNVVSGTVKIYGKQ